MHQWCVLDFWNDPLHFIYLFIYLVQYMYIHNLFKYSYIVARFKAVRPFPLDLPMWLISETEFQSICTDFYCKAGLKLFVLYKSLYK